MGLTVLPNQPIDFHLEDEDNCACIGQHFCQIISRNDPTQFQIVSNDLVFNGRIYTNVGWNVGLGIVLTIIDTNVSVIGQCDGTATVTATNFTAPIEFSLDGITYFTGAPNDHTFTGLCEGTYFITCKDSIGSQASIEFRITHNIACTDYTNTIDFDTINTLQLSNCYTIDFT